MKKKIIFKTLGIIVLLAGLVLAYFTGRGILEGNKTYDLFRRIRVDMKDVQADIDKNGLDAVKEEYRDAFAVLDQVDALGTQKAQVYLDDVNTAYGLIDTMEATEHIVAQINSIGVARAREGLNMIYDAIGKIKDASELVASAPGNVSVHLEEIGAVLENQDDLTAAREEVYAKYASDLDRETAEIVNGSYDEDKAKQLRTFFINVFKRLESYGKEELAYLSSVAEISDVTPEKFAVDQVQEEIRAGAPEDMDQMLEYTNEVFRLIEDQGTERAQTYLSDLLSTMEKKSISDARAYLEEGYSSGENAALAKYLDSAFRMMDEKGTDYAKLHGGDICADASGHDEAKAQVFLAAVEQEIKADSGAGTIDRLNRIYDTIQEAGSAAGGSANPYLTDFYSVFSEIEAGVSTARKAQQEVDDAVAAAEEKKLALEAAEEALKNASTDTEKAAAQTMADDAQKEYDSAQKTIDKKRKLAQKRQLEEDAARDYSAMLETALANAQTNISSPELREKARQIQNDMCQLIDHVGLERAKKYTEYATGKALSDKTLRISEIGTDNTKTIDALDETKVFLIRNKAELMMLTVLCLIIGIILLCIRPKDSAAVKMSREERKKAGSHMGLSASRTIANTVIHAVLILISVIWLIPFISIVMQSLRVESTHQVGYIMPIKIGFNNYIDLFSTDFVRWYTNTFIMALVVAVLQTIIVLCMSYTLSRFRFKMRKLLMRFMLILGMFPGMLTMIILYRVLKDLGLTQANAVPGLILVYIASSGMGYYVSKGFFDTIPKSLDEAARVDGATRAKVLMKIILPLSKPIVIYTVLTAFMGPWGDYVFARYISFGTSAGMNAAVGLNNWLSKDQIASRYTMFCAGGVLVAIPVAILFMCLQKYYVEGVTGGAVKG